MMTEYEILRRKLLRTIRLYLYKRACDLIIRDYFPELRLAFIKIGEASSILLSTIRAYIKEIERYEKE